IVMTTGGGQTLTVLDTLTGLTGFHGGLVVSNGVPLVISVTPPSAIANGATVTLTVNGSNFVVNSVVQWNGVSLLTTYISGTLLHAALPTGQNPGTGAITVLNPAPGGGESNTRVFT